MENFDCAAGAGTRIFPQAAECVPAAQCFDNILFCLPVIMFHAQPVVASDYQDDPVRLEEREPKRAKTTGQENALAEMPLPCPEQAAAELAAANLCAIVCLQ